MTQDSVEWQRLNAFVDGELDLAGQLALEARLPHDPLLRAQVEALRRDCAALREQADYHAAPAALKARLARMTGAAAPAEAAPAAAPAATPRAATLAAAGRVAPRWLAWRPMVLAWGMAAFVAFALELALSDAQHDAQHEEQLGHEVIASHVRASLAERLVDVVSSDHHTVKPWLSARLDFSPPVHELGLPGSTLLGGRVDYIGGRPVAVLAYRQGQHVVEAFSWPVTGGDQAVQTRTERGFRTAHWAGGGMAHWVVSDLNPEEFAAVVRAIGAAVSGP